MHLIGNTVLVRNTVLARFYDYETCENLDCQKESGTDEQTGRGTDS
jgi:hypothetical protein